MIRSNTIAPDLKEARNRTEFEIVRALTRTARDVAGKIKDDLPRKFTLRRQWVVKGIRFDAASKANPVAHVYSIDPYMLKQEKGESYSPSGQHVAIPVDVRRNPRSSIPPGMLPRNALNRRDVFKSVLRGGGPAIVQRKKDGIKILYLLRGKKVTKPRWGFSETAELVVEKRFTRNLV
jgi:hypothetical protein